MTCIIGRSHTSEDYDAVVQLFKSYDVNSTNPSSNTIDPTYSGAEVVLNYSNGMSFELEEDTLIYTINDSIVFMDTNRYGNPQIIYVARKLPWHSGLMQIFVTLKDGNKIAAESQIPNATFFEYSYPFPHGITPNIDQWRHGDYFGIYWDSNEFHLYFSELILTYSKTENDSSVKFYDVPIPLSLLNNDGKIEPIYPKYSNKGKLEFKFDAIEYALTNISEEDPDRQKYRIYGLELVVVEYDIHLSKYYSSINGYLDDYSIRLDESIYSNVSSGLGIFGTYRINTMEFEIDEDYIHSLGYKTRNE
jgi:hypothetical protein